jgi:predicted flap endonuclease-1-like 5' DNA nuclease
LGAVVGFAIAFSGVAALVWLLWRLFEPQEEPETAMIEIELEAEPVPTTAEAPSSDAEATTPPESGPPDDLKRIEGIGPKLSQVLQAAGITTYAQLADTPVGQIEQILEEADPRLLRLAKPESWSEQAALAAAGEWEALEALQQKR